HDCPALAPLRQTIPFPATLGRSEHRVDERLPFIDLTLLAQRVRKIGQNVAQYLFSAPLLKAAMHRFVVGIALRQHVPLRAGVQNPQHRFEHLARGYRLAAWATFGDVFLRKMIEKCPRIRPQAKTRPSPARWLGGREDAREIRATDRPCGGAWLGCAGSRGSASRPRCARIRSIVAGASM